MSHVVPVVSEDSLLRAPPVLEAPKTLVMDSGPAQTHASISVLSAPFDGFPHGEIVWPEMLVMEVRCSKLVHGFSPEIKVNGPSNVLAGIGREHDKA